MVCPPLIVLRSVATILHVVSFREADRVGKIALASCRVAASIRRFCPPYGAPSYISESAISFPENLAAERRPSLVILEIGRAIRQIINLARFFRIFEIDARGGIAEALIDQLPLAREHIIDE